MSYRLHQIGSGVALVLGAALVGLPAPAAAQVACGDVITSNTSLQGDLSCGTDPALTVEGPARLDLKGFTVACDDSGNGIVLTGTNARLTNGTVSDCNFLGVVVDGDGQHHVSKVTAEFNGNDGFLIFSDNNQLVNNIGRFNNFDGFEIDGGNNNQLVNKLADQNGREGIFIFEGTGNRLVRNTLTNNNDGIELDDADFNAIIANIVRNNGTDGMDIEGNNNEIRANRIENNEDQGIRVRNFSENNQITGNKAFGNSVDLDDQNPDCDNNLWRGNQFGTASQACIR